MKIKNPSLQNLFKNEQNKTYTMVGLTVLTVGVFVFLAIRPSYTKINELREEIKVKEELLQKMKSKRETIQYLVEKKDEISDQLPSFEDAFPQKPEEAFIIANVSSIAQQDSVLLKSIEFNKKTDKDYLNEASEFGTLFLKVDLSLTGDYVQLEEFIDDLSSFPRIFDIRSISYSKIEAEEGEVAVGDELSINISFYTPYLEGEEELNL